jgi:hypothetical protein
MPPKRTSLDTAPVVERAQIDRWRQMSPAEKAAIVAGMSDAVHRIALAGVRARYPNATCREQFLRLALVTLGPTLARKAYPDISTLDRIGLIT